MKTCSLSPIPDRRYYPNGRLRKITHAEGTLFAAHLAAALAHLPASPEPRPGWIAQTDFGPLLIHKPLIEHPYSLYYYVNMAFQDDAGLAKARESLTYALHALNAHSAKWNILMPEGGDVLDELKVRLTSVGA